jgi:hypothetical protein
MLSIYGQPCSNVITFPWTEGFEAGLTCPINASISQWQTVSRDDNGALNGHNGSTRFARLDAYNISGFNNPVSLYLPTFTLGATPKSLTYHYWLGKYGNKGTTGNAGNDPFPLEVLISTDSSVTWTSIFSHTAANSTFNNEERFDWHRDRLDLTAYANKTVNIHFVGRSNATRSYAYNMDIDDLKIDNTPACAEPIYTNAYILDTSARIN